jgi:hypothetical protein
MRAHSEYTCAARDATGTFALHHVLLAGGGDGRPSGSTVGALLCVGPDAAIDGPVVGGRHRPPVTVHRGQPRDDKGAGAARPHRDDLGAREQAVGRGRQPVDNHVMSRVDALQRPRLPDGLGAQRQDRGPFVAHREQRVGEGPTLGQGVVVARIVDAERR